MRVNALVIATCRRVNVAKSVRLDQNRKEMSWQIKWNKLYNVVISRKESKKTGRKKASVSDTLVSFIEIDEKLSEI